MHIPSFGYPGIGIGRDISGYVDLEPYNTGIQPLFSFLSFSLLNTLISQSGDKEQVTLAKVQFYDIFSFVGLLQLFPIEASVQKSLLKSDR